MLDRQRREQDRAQETAPRSGVAARATRAQLRIIVVKIGYVRGMTKTASGLEYEDTAVGTGASPSKGQTCVMHYTGWLWVNGAKGAKFDSSRRSRRAVRVPDRRWAA